MKVGRNFAIALIIVGAGAVGAFFVPAASAQTATEIQAQIRQLLAQVASLQAQLAKLTTPSTTPPLPPDTVQHRICSVLYRNLSPGARGDDVLGLQEFLRSEGYLSANATGYFGPLTAQAVAKWQAAQGVSAVGSVGPMTRERIQRWCRGGGGPIVCTKEYAPVCGSKPIVCITTPCDPIEQTYGNLCAMEADGATFIHQGACGAPAGRPPTISSFSGPTTLDVDQMGTWTIQASDPENGQLTYSITWGDEVIAPAPMATFAARETFVQTTTFTHSYSATGTYTISIVVRDSSGQEARSTTTVRIGESPTYCTLEYNPVCGQKTTCPACYYSQPAFFAPFPL